MGSEMISFSQAMHEIDELAAARTAEYLSREGLSTALQESVGRVLAQNVSSAYDIPPFANSAMDGFAVRSRDLGFARKSRPSVHRRNSLRWRFSRPGRSRWFGLGDYDRRSGPRWL